MKTDELETKRVVGCQWWQFGKTARVYNLRVDAVTMNDTILGHVDVDDGVAVPVVQFPESAFLNDLRAERYQDKWYRWQDRCCLNEATIGDRQYWWDRDNDMWRYGLTDRPCIDRTDCLTNRDPTHVELPYRIIVSRHYATAQVLQGVITRETGSWSSVPVLSHVEPADVRDRHVYGNLPLRLAAEARKVTTLPLDLPEERRADELTVHEVQEYAGDPETYVVER